MINPIIEEVRSARAALSAEHGHDIHRITEWARQRTEALKTAGRQPLAKELQATGRALKSPEVRKRRVRTAGPSA